MITPLISYDIPMATCAVPGCKNPTSAKGWCSMHYMRWKRHGDPEVIVRTPARAPQQCSVPWCDKWAVTRGWCRLHYDRWRKTGSALTRNRYDDRDNHCQHPESQRWYNMMARCYNPTSSRYARYGGRGIQVCEEWHDPWTFCRYLDETLGPCPPDHTLDRINNDGNYEPGNIRWATYSEQNQNR